MGSVNGIMASEWPQSFVPSGKPGSKHAVPPAGPHSTMPISEGVKTALIRRFVDIEHVKLLR